MDKLTVYYPFSPQSPVMWIKEGVDKRVTAQRDEVYLAYTKKTSLHD